MKIVQIGNGKAAYIHRLSKPRSFEVVALVVVNVRKHKEKAASDKTLPANVLVTDSLKKIFSKFGHDIGWDIVSDDETHFDYVKKILALDREARIMLGKTPYDKKIIGKFLKLLGQFPKAKISVTENYLASNVTSKIKELMKKYKIKGKEIVIEFTKNRIKDIENGRYVHKDIGVLGYEGSHMLAILDDLGKKVKKIGQVKFDDMRLSNGKILKNQGLCDFDLSGEDFKAKIHCSMNGKVKHKLEFLGVKEDIPYGDETRFRVVIVGDKDDKKIIGQYDPVPQGRRLQGKVFVLDGGKIVEEIDEIQDNTLKIVLEKQIDAFRGKYSDPFPLEKARNYSILEDVYKKANWR